MVVFSESKRFIKQNKQYVDKNRSCTPNNLGAHDLLHLPIMLKFIKLNICAFSFFHF